MMRFANSTCLKAKPKLQKKLLHCWKSSKSIRLIGFQHSRQNENQTTKHQRGIWMPRIQCKCKCYSRSNDDDGDGDNDDFFKVTRMATRLIISWVRQTLHTLHRNTWIISTCACTLYMCIRSNKKSCVVSKAPNCYTYSLEPNILGDLMRIDLE